MIDRERCLLITQGLPINVPIRSSYLIHEGEREGGGVCTGGEGWCMFMGGLGWLYCTWVGGEGRMFEIRILMTLQAISSRFKLMSFV